MEASSSKQIKRKLCRSNSSIPQTLLQKKNKVSELEALVDDYQVFLSFRGPDTRKNFTDVLYYHMDRVGIRVFRDDDVISIGQPIDTILQAIRKSEICVPVFSKSFAASPWCLREVETMVDLGKEVVPIFYKVCPDDVKLKTELYKNALLEYEPVYGKEQVQRWKDALVKISKVKGREMCASTSYTEFCKGFVEEVLVKLKPSQSYDTDHLVGTDDQVESAMQLLSIGSTEVRYLGIHGMGGIGKTTLAEVIFNNLSTSFDCCSFVRNIRDSSKHNSLCNLQTQLLQDLDPKSAMPSNFERAIRERFCRRKVLIVLDDVDTWEQVQMFAGKSSWFGSESRIIITTRDMRVFRSKHMHLREYDIHYLEMKTLKSDHALQLFCRHALGKDSPPHDFESLSNEAIATAGGLPLALEVIGSLLFEGDQDHWEDVIARSKIIPHEEVKSKLKISYDKLEPDRQEIFLHIACLFIGKERSNAVYLWQACGLYPHAGLEVLKKMSLIKVTDDDKLWMHDQLRDLGRDIVRRQSIHDAGKRTIIWEPEEGLKAVISKERKANVQAITIGAPGRSLTPANFARLENLRFLEVEKAEFRGDFDSLFSNLRWLSFYYLNPFHFEVSNLVLTNLVILDLSHNLICERSSKWSQIQELYNLKVLNLTDSQYLRTTPKFSEENKSLERLILKDCKSLEAIDSSISNLRGLKYLELGGCTKLLHLPEELHYLENLTCLSLGGCHRLEALPNSIGELKSLADLDLHLTGIRSLPDSIGFLSKLERLFLSWSRLKALPDSLGQLESLSVLYVGETKISNLPDFIGGPLLQRLSLIGCDLDSIPYSLGRLKSLTHLDLQYQKISQLPDSVGALVSLKHLSLSSCSRLKTLPESIGDLMKLQRLSLYRCHELKVLPESLGQLESLTDLDLGETKISILPDSIGCLESLQHLSLSSCSGLKLLPTTFTDLKSLLEVDLSRTSIQHLPQRMTQLSLLRVLIMLRCDELIELPELPPSLHKLHITSYMLRRVPDLNKMINLEDFKLTNDFAHSPSGPFQYKRDGLLSLFPYYIRKLPENLVNLQLRNEDVASIPANISKLSKLKALDLGCPNLTSIPQFPAGLSSLCLAYVQQETDLPNLSNLQSLKSLTFYRWSKGDGYGCLGIEHLRCLSSFRLSGFRNMIDLKCLRFPKKLRELELSIEPSKVFRRGLLYCIKELPDLSSLKNLKKLLLSDFANAKITVPMELEDLQELTFVRCPYLEHLDGLSELKELKIVAIKSCDMLSHVNGIDNLTMEYFLHRQISLSRTQMDSFRWSAKDWPWTAPPGQWLKWNVDGLLYKKDGDQGGIGGVLRNNRGQVLCMFLEVAIGSFGGSLSLVNKAVRKAMEISAVESCMENKSIIIEVDSLECFHFLSEEKDSQWSSCTKFFNEVCFQHAPPEFNSMANHLAKSSFLFSESIVEWCPEK